MNTITSSDRYARVTVRIRNALAPLRRAVARREFSRLDASTLRDLGMTRSEFDSYWAEAHGQAEQTRVRVIRNVRGRWEL